MTDLRNLLRILIGANVEFILVGGVAGVAHGSSRLTQDVDIVYRRTPENVRKLVKALTPLSPYLRGAPAGLPFSLDEATINRGLNFTLTTDAGFLDLFGEIAGGGTYEALQPDSTTLNVFGMACRCLSLDQLIHAKRAAGRPRDYEAIAELEALREEKDNSE